MSNQIRQRRRDQRWRMNRQLNNRRRVNLWLLEKRVNYLEGREEVFALDLENTHDLMKQLEVKVQGLVAEVKTLKNATTTTQPSNPILRFWHWVRDVLCAKGNP